MTKENKMVEIIIMPHSLITQNMYIHFITQAENQYNKQ